ncbi:MAG: hypothetical protein M3Q98_12625 [Actinomycetota bacterium]|nr:hypothetical protein [Actinomycetota bacterium]
MKKIAGVLFLLLALVVTGCKGADKEAKPKPTTTAGPAVTFASLGGDEWPVGDDGISLDALPPTPAGFTDADVRQLAVIIVKWAKVSALDKNVFHSAAPAEIVTATLPSFPSNDLFKDVSNAVSPRLSAANVFGDDIDVASEPRMTSAWTAAAITGDDGVPYLSVKVQTRTAYEVSDARKARRVIGVVRQHGLSSYGANQVDEQYGESWSWQEFGANGCQLVTEDALIPDADLADARKELESFVDIVNNPKVVEHKLDKEDRVDEDYQKRCQGGGS